MGCGYLGCQNQCDQCAHFPLCHIVWLCMSAVQMYSVCHGTERHYTSVDGPRLPPITIAFYGFTSNYRHSSWRGFCKKNKTRMRPKLKLAIVLSLYYNCRIIVTTWPLATALLNIDPGTFFQTNNFLWKLNVKLSQICLSSKMADPIYWKECGIVSCTEQ